MKLPILLITSITLIASCSGGDEVDQTENGYFKLQFDQSVSGKSTKTLSAPLEENYPYTNSLGQPYNLTTIRYIISEVVLEGPNGAYFEDELLVSRDETKGYYLIDESDIPSQSINLENIPPGTYNKVSFTLGVNEDGVEQGTGIFLSGMFWTWNSGYIALKVEGQSPDSPGEAFGDSIEETNPFGFAYHIGGWNEPNNNQRYALEFEPLLVDPQYRPKAHIAMIVNNIFDGVNPVDFSDKNSVHTPGEGTEITENLDHLFEIAHVHQ
ncbi:MAG: hypothetical protein RIC35_04465 [Marinoscillum sp.]